MDDLNSMLTSILGDPGKMEQLRQVAQSIGLSPGGAAAPSGQPDGGNAAPGGFDPSAIASLLQNLQGSGNCLLYTSDAADEQLCGDLGGPRISKKKKKITNRQSQPA